MDENTLVRIERYLAGDMPEEEGAEFLRSLGRSPEELEYLGRALEQQALLFDALREDSSGSSRRGAVGARLRLRRSGVWRARRRTVRVGWVPLAVAAAAAAAVLLVFRPFGPAPARGPQPDLTARLVAASGGVEVVGERGRVAATPGATVGPGWAVETGAGAAATLRYPDGSVIEIRERSRLALERSDGAKRLELPRGAILASVATQPAGRPMVFTTPHAMATVLGTRFELSSGEASTRLDVMEGRVRFVRRSDGSSVELAAGEHAVAEESTVLVARDLRPAETPPQPVPQEPPQPVAQEPPATPRAGPVVFQDDFQLSAPGLWPRGWIKHREDPSSRSGFVVQEDAADGNRFIGCVGQRPGTTQHAFFPVAEMPESFEVSFRIRMAGPRSSRAGIELEDVGDLQHPTFEYDAGRSVVKATERRPAVRSLSQAGIRLEPGVWYSWVVRVEGGRFSLSIDGRQVLSAEMTRAGRPSRPSLISCGQDSAQFDDVRVTALGEGGPVPRPARREVGR